MKLMTADGVSRRHMFACTAGGTAALMGLASKLSGADWTAAEKANVQVVTDFCAAFASHDIGRVMSSFSDQCAYRISEKQQPATGRQAVTERIGSYLQSVERFEILETLAKGPMVFNERQDHFTSGRLKMWHGVGVFFLLDGKIVEWYDYTISMQTA